METTFIILSATIVLFVINKLRADLVALLSLLSLFLFGILDARQALAGFADNVVIMVAGLFVVSEGLTRTRVTAWMGQKLFGLAGTSELRLLVFVMGFTALLSAFISNTGTTAILMPVVVAAAWRIGSFPSRLLLPMAFAANLGGMLTLIGTAPNIVVADALTGADLEPFGFFDFTLIGLPVIICVCLFIATVGRKLVPSYSEVSRLPDLDSSMKGISKSYSLHSKLYRICVTPQSALAEKSIKELHIGRDYGVIILSIERDSRGTSSGKPRKIIPEAQTVIEKGDHLIVKAAQENLEMFARQFGLDVQKETPLTEDITSLLLTSEAGIAEIIIAPRSDYAGQTLTESRFSEKYKLRVMSIKRSGKVLPRSDTPLEFGDCLLVRGTWGAVEKMRKEDTNFVVVGNPEIIARQVVDLTPRSFVAIAILGSMVALMASGILPPAMAVLSAAAAMALTGCVTLDDAYRSIGWQTVIILAAMLPMGTALETTGGASFLADGIVNTVGTLGPLVLMASIYLLTAGLSQVISNTATAVLMSPIVIQTSMTLDVSPYPFLMMVALGASSAFLTPISTPVNTLVLGPGGYAFKDYAKLGFPLLIIALTLGLLLIPLIWPF